MEILGLLDALEQMILDGFKIPLSSKTMVNEEKLLAIVDKIRLVVQGGGDFAKKAIDREKHVSVMKTEILDEAIPKRGAAGKAVDRGEKKGDFEGKAIEVLQQAYQIAKDVRQGADKYADEVLASLEATSSRILRAVKAGRERLSGVVKEGKAEEPKSIGDILRKDEKPKPSGKSEEETIS
jgi:hypothetical protein